MIYLDNAATTQVHPLVLEAIPYFQNQYGNPSTKYTLGREAHEAVEKARAQVAKFINAEPHQIIFTSGGTESNNTVFKIFNDNCGYHGSALISAVEHDSVRRAAWFSSRITFDEIPVDECCRVTPADVERALDFYTGAGLVSVMYMNNETGTENDVAEIAKVCRAHDVLFHTDCVQAAGCCQIDVKKIDCDFLSLSSHKIHGPKGAGALHIKNPEDAWPLICGGESQEFGLRGGTENVPGIVGFGKACELMTENLRDIDIHCSVLKQTFYSTLEGALAENGIAEILHINGDPVMKHGKTLNVRFDGIDAETLLLLLDKRGVCVSAGSACHSLQQEPSRVLLAMGLTPEQARGSIRVSFSMVNTKEEVIDAAKIMASCVRGLREMS